VWILARLDAVGLGDQFLLPLLLVTWITAAVLIVVLSLVQRTPWGRVLRAIREDEDAARSLGKNTFAYKLQSLAIGAALGRWPATSLPSTSRSSVPRRSSCCSRSSDMPC
jgi:ABC-type branched-subunit amino acid transport system permease subunit